MLALCWRNKTTYYAQSNASILCLSLLHSTESKGTGGGPIVHEAPLAISFTDTVNNIRTVKAGPLVCYSSFSILLIWEIRKLSELAEQNLASAQESQTVWLHSIPPPAPMGLGISIGRASHRRRQVVGLIPTQVPGFFFLGKTCKCYCNDLDELGLMARASECQRWQHRRVP